MKEKNRPHHMKVKKLILESIKKRKNNAWTHLIVKDVRKIYPGLWIGDILRPLKTLENQGRIKYHGEIYNEGS